MLEIVTTTGVSLDMEKDLDIQVELEQPLLDADHLPVAYSTQISFPFTETNKTAFGFVPAMMLEPSVKQLDARILFYGRELFSGSLVYDGVEDGKLKYIFTENGLTEYLEKDVAPAEAESVSWDEMQRPGAKYRMPMIADKKFANYYYPSAGNGDIYYTEKDVKYRNCILNGSGAFLPAVRISSLLPFLDIGAFTDIESILERLYLLCPYGSGMMTAGTAEVVSERYPQVTREVIALLCSAVYKHNGRYLMYPARKTFYRDDDNILFWEEKVSDIYSLVIERKKNYRFTFEDEAIIGEDASSEGSLPYNMPFSLLSIEHPNTHTRRGYYPTSADVTNSFTVFSTRSHSGATAPGSGREILLYDTDIVYRNRGKAENIADSNEDFEQSCQFIPVDTTPERIVEGSVVGGNYIFRDFRAPQLKMPTEDEGRGNKLYIGIMSEAEMPYEAEAEYLPSLVENPQDGSGFSLFPPDLFNDYHKKFAEWMGTDRTVVKTDLDLTVDDLTELALYKRVNFRGRDWMIKRLSLTFHTDGGHFEATGEFISL